MGRIIVGASVQLRPSSPTGLFRDSRNSLCVTLNHPLRGAVWFSEGGGGWGWGGAVNTTPDGAAARCRRSSAHRAGALPSLHRRRGAMKNERNVNKVRDKFYSRFRAIFCLLQ